LSSCCHKFRALVTEPLTDDEFHYLAHYPGMELVERDPIEPKTYWLYPVAGTDPITFSSNLIAFFESEFHGRTRVTFVFGEPIPEKA